MPDSANGVNDAQLRNAACLKRGLISEEGSQEQTLSTLHFADKYVTSNFNLVQITQVIDGDDPAFLTTTINYIFPTYKYTE